MRLIELNPRWITDNLFAFHCPHCKKVFLTCKNVPIGRAEQIELLQRAELEPTGPRYGVVQSKPNVAWSWDSKNFETMTVTPSIDASESGHWHGHIRKGAIA